MSVLKEYLQQKYSPATVKAYCYDIDNYCRYIGQNAAQNAQYKDILAYIKHLRERPNTKNHTLQRIICALKRYYDYLIEAEIRTHHPCHDMLIKDKRPKAIQIQDLFSTIELEHLLERKERYKHLQSRNKLIMSLLIYQALSAAEITHLTLNDVDLDCAKLRIKASNQSEGRFLDLKATQISLFFTYINTDRPLLNTKESSFLVISKLGTNETTDCIQYLVSTFQPLFNRKLTPTTIRQSVITNQLRSGQELRYVQDFAGHRRISSTEHYKVNGLEELKSAILTHHPLDKLVTKNHQNDFLTA
jgi:integrase/recombinase XerD